MIFIHRFAFIVFLFFPQLAFAHSPIQGIGSLFNGVIHPFLVPSHVIAIVALGLLLGLHKPAQNKLTVWLFLLATSIGLFLSGLSIHPDVSLWLLIIATIISLIVVSNIALPLPLQVIFALSSGLLLGLDSVMEMPSSKDTIIALFGSGVGIYFMLLYAMALSESASRKSWSVIAVRVIASWLSASALMVLVLNFSS